MKSIMKILGLSACFLFAQNTLNAASQTMVIYFQNNTADITYKYRNHGTLIAPGSKIDTDHEVKQDRNNDLHADVAAYKGVDLTAAYEKFKKDKAYTPNNQIPPQWATQELWVRNYLGGTVTVFQTGGAYSNPKGIVCAGWLCSKNQMKNERGNVMGFTRVLCSWGINGRRRLGAVVRQTGLTDDGSLAFQFDLTDAQPSGDPACRTG
jgi:hypothetical protein